MGSEQIEVGWRIGDTIEKRWEVHRILVGGMGIVYLVYDNEAQQAFAAKTFREDLLVQQPDLAERFRNEARAWIELDRHQNVTRAHFIQNVRGRPLLFLEYASGGDLGRWIGSPRLTEDPRRVLSFAIQFCDGMIHATGKGIKAHRDIKRGCPEVR
jgi:serine/threonine protein kinase